MKQENNISTYEKSLKNRQELVEIDIQKYIEHVNLLKEDTKKLINDSFVDKVDVLKNHFRHFWLYEHGIFLDEFMYHMKEISCSTTVHTNPDYLWLEYYGNDRLLFINIDNFDTLPDFAQKQLWQLYVKEDRTESNLQDFISTEMKSICLDVVNDDKKHKFSCTHRKISFLYKWKFLYTNLNPVTNDKYIIRLWEHNDQCYLIMHKPILD